MSKEQLITNKRANVPLKITLKLGHTSRQAGNGRWVPHQRAAFCNVAIGDVDVAGFSMTLRTYLQADGDEWVTIECDSIIQELARYGLASPQILSTKELADDVRLFISANSKWLEPETAKA